MNRKLLPIFAILLVDVLGFTIILPLLPFYAEHMGASAFLAGLLVSVYGLCQLLAGPILGPLSDRIGRKPVLLVSQLGTFAGFLILANAKTLPLVFISRVIDGLTAGNFSVAQAYISDVAEPRQRAKSFGLIGIAFGIGFILGPAISGFLAPFGIHYPIYAAAALSATSILLTQFLLPAARPEAHPKKDAAWKHYLRWYRVPELSKLLWQFSAFIFAFAMFVSTFPLFAERRPFDGHAGAGATEVGFMFAFWGLVGIVIQGMLIGKLVERFGEKKLVVTGFIATALAYVILVHYSTLYSLLLLLTLTAIGGSLLRPSLTSLITQHVDRTEQGMAMGLLQVLQSLAQITAPVLGGWMMGRLYLPQWAWIGAAISLIGLL
jgi:MFS family permease